MIFLLHFSFSDSRNPSLCARSTKGKTKKKERNEKEKKNLRPSRHVIVAHVDTALSCYSQVYYSIEWSYLRLYNELSSHFLDNCTSNSAYSVSRIDLPHLTDCALKIQPLRLKKWHKQIQCYHWYCVLSKNDTIRATCNIPHNCASYKDDVSPSKYRCNQYHISMVCVLGPDAISTNHGEYVCNIIQRPLWQKGNEDFDGGSRCSG